MRFLSKIFHPNVYNDGKICLDILQNQWSPIYDIAAILTSSKSLSFFEDTEASFERFSIYPEVSLSYPQLKLRMSAVTSLLMSSVG